MTLYLSNFLEVNCVSAGFLSKTIKIILKKVKILSVSHSYINGKKCLKI